MALISNDHLQYVFQGLTTDGKYYVVAEMPVSVPFLPDDSPEEFEGYRRLYLLEDYSTPDTIKARYKDYVRSITTRLEKLPADKFRPALRHFEEMIASIRVKQ
jgi:hypothetical protein